MCGIAGIYNFNKNQAVSPSELQSMADSIAHRGPDNQSIFTHQNAGLGYRRLSIIDTTEQKQPILTNEDQTLRISFNGEIYNFPELKQELLEKGHQFYTGTDTEMLLHLYEEERKECVKRLNGIFAIAILDLKNNSLFIARDHVGIKPLYYTEQDGRLAFASEIKALLKLPWVKRQVNPEAVPLYFRYRFVPDPLTMFENIFKLLPGNYMYVNQNGIKIKQYWQLSSKFKTENLKMRYQTQNEEEIINLVRDTLRAAVKRQLLSDVPLGAFLSGGLDSSIVVAIMSQIMKEPVKTFSIGFSESDYDEMHYARQISKRYHTDHHEIVLQPAHVKAIPEIIWHLDEPLADPAAVPTYFLSEMARKDVTVVLTGEGGDELFAGYKEDFPYPLNHLFKLLPYSGRIKLAQLIAQLPNRPGKTRLYRSLLPERERAEHVLTDLFRFELIPLSSTTFPSHKSKIHIYSFEEYWGRTTGWDWLTKMLYLETIIWLCGDPLMKVDKMTMGHGLEARVPILDLEMVELAAQIPSGIKNKGGVEKHLLRKAFEDILPLDILERKKTAFEIPIREWLQEELEPLVNKFLSREKLMMSGYLNVDQVRQIIQKHTSGKKDYKYEIWAILCFQLWYERWFTP